MSILSYLLYIVVSSLYIISSSLRLSQQTLSTAHQVLLGANVVAVSTGLIFLGGCVYSESGVELTLQQSSKGDNSDVNRATIGPLE